MGFGMGWGWIVPLLILGFFLYLIFGRGEARGDNEAEKILKKRFARGEIDEEEYRRRLGILKGGGDASP
jgi:putative membrane protein